MRRYKNSFMTNLRRDTSVSQSLRTRHHSSLFAKRTASYDQCKTIARLMPLLSGISTPFLSSQTSFATSGMHIYTRNLMFAGGTTTYAFMKEMKRRRHSKTDTDFLNLQSCTSDSLIRQ